MKTLAQIALATIFFTTSMMVFAEPATTSQSQSETATTSVKHKAMTVTLTDKHFTSSDEKHAATTTQAPNHKTNSATQPSI